MTPSSNAATRTTRYTNSLPERRRNLLSIPPARIPRPSLRDKRKSRPVRGYTRRLFFKKIEHPTMTTTSTKWTEQSEDSFEITSRSIRLSHPPRNM
ncbi:hypothetical protein TNCV_4779581 [Trichonephila clavipes]|nr:hypothetical protein TNCV_4779581 [Trichonephila clavipes]